jgi:hypothetical protein
MQNMTKKSMVEISAMAAVGMFALFIFNHNKADVDLWGNVGFVKHLAFSAECMRVNTFSFTDTEHVWINHEWLSEYILFQAYRLSGNPGLLLLKLLLGIGLLGIINNAMRQTIKSQATRVLLLLLIISTIGYGFSTRPHLFTYLLSAGLLSILLRQKAPAALLLTAAPLGCLWANLHGAFFIGQILLLLAFACALLRKVTKHEATWRTTLITGGAALAFFAGTLLNPYGIKLWNFVFESAAILRPILSEWAPFNPRTQFSDHIDFMALLVVTLIATASARRTFSPLGLTTLLLALASALLMRRNIPLFAIVAGLTAPKAIDQTIGNHIEGIVQKLDSRVPIAILSTLTMVAAGLFIHQNIKKPLDIKIPPDRFPAEAMAFMQENNIQANVITFFDWAEYSIWHLYPNCRQFLDGRFKSAYSEKTIRDYLDFIYGKNLKAITDYPTDMVFVHVGNPCTQVMLKQPGWQIIYHDQMAVIFAKHTAIPERITQPDIASKPLSFP